MLSLHNLQTKPGVNKAKKRVGRGNASGRGTYSTRGLKGQKARSGGKSGLTARSMKSYLLGIPKTRGFRSLTAKMAIVNLKDLQSQFNDGQLVNLRTLIKKGLVQSLDNGVKILSAGSLTKKLTVEAHAFSESAKKAIETAGGKVIVIALRPVEKIEKK